MGNEISKRQFIDLAILKRDRLLECTKARKNTELFLGLE